LTYRFSSHQLPYSTELATMRKRISSPNVTQMKTKLSLAVAAMLVVGGWIAISAARPPVVGREVRISGGRSAINFLPSILKSKHLNIDMNYRAKGEGCSSCGSPGFHMSDANLVLRVVNGHLAAFGGGKISHEGTFKVTDGDKSVSGNNLTLSASKTSKSGLSLRVDSAKGSMVAFDLATPKGLYRANEDELVVEDMDILVSQSLAEELGQPDLTGSPIGTVTLYAESEAIDGGGEVALPRASAASAGLDLSLFAMSSLSVASSPTGRVGTFPNGRNGLTMSTTSCNVGTVNVPWNAPMQTQHPVIAMNLYRQLNGRFEQVGWSWLKHGFFATNSSGCGSCQNPGTGALLGVNCSDTYGTGNNSDRTYLGGRDEVNPFTGVWTCQGSWFSNFQNDCTRRNPGVATLDAVDHRLDVLDSDMGNAGARYFYEAYYITANDINTYNNIGSRETSMSWNGSAWNISTIGNQGQGTLCEDDHNPDRREPFDY